MTEQLKEAVDLAVQKLPDKEQNMLARYIVSLLEVYEAKKGLGGTRWDTIVSFLEAYEEGSEEYEEEKEWDAIVNRPGFLEKMEKLMHESLASGVEDGGFCP
jgi:hypothetical protein